MNKVQGDIREFNSLATILKTNEEFKGIWAVKSGYLAALYVIKIDYPDQAEAERYKPKANLSKDTTKSSCYYQYINTHLDLSEDTLKAALTNKAYVNDECWINIIYDN